MHPPAHSLQRILRANGIFCVVSGLVLAVFNNQIQDLLGVENVTMLLIIVGIFLLGYGAFLYISMIRPTLNIPIAYLAEIGDITWVIASIIVLALDLFDLSTAGRWAILVATDIVATFAIVQFVYLRRIHLTS